MHVVLHIVMGRAIKIDTYIYIHTYIHTHTYMHNSYIHIHTYTHTYIHTYILTYIQTYIHTHTWCRSCQRKTDISFIQEPYIYQNIPKGISTGYRTYTHGEGKSRAAIIITNDTLDAILITQYWDNDTVLLEIHKGSNRFYVASFYMEYNEQIDNKLQTIEQNRVHQM